MNAIRLVYSLVDLTNVLALYDENAHVFNLRRVDGVEET